MAPPITEPPLERFNRTARAPRGAALGERRIVNDPPAST